MVFLNKLDRPGASFSASFSSLLAHRLHSTPVALTIPIASFNPQNYQNAEPGIEGIVDLVNWEVRKYGEEGEVEEQFSLPTTLDELEKLDLGRTGQKHPLIPLLAQSRSSLIETVAMNSEPLMTKILDFESMDYFLQFPAEEFLPYLRDAVLDNSVLPVLCGAAADHIGTDLVLDYVGKLLASPVDVASETSIATVAPLRVLAWKVVWDQRRGWMTFVRVYSGMLAYTLRVPADFHGKRQVN